jgi:membrane-bound inhibitor of C-type lysozyme
MVAMVTIVINHVMDVYLIPVIKNMVSVQIHLDVNLEDSMDRRSVIYVCSGNDLLLHQNNKQKQMKA